MRVLVVGDTHAAPASVPAINTLVSRYGVNEVWQCGDLGYWPRDPQGRRFLERFAGVSVPTYFADGNHEDHSQLEHNETEAYEVTPNVWHVPRGVVREVADKRVLFFGGAVSVDRAWRVPEWTWFKDEVPSQEHWDRLRECGYVDVVVAHDAPHEVDFGYSSWSESPWPDAELRSSQVFRTRLTTEVLDRLTPDVWFSGHHHQRRTQELEDLTVVHALNQWTTHGSDWVVTYDLETGEVFGVL